MEDVKVKIENEPQKQNNETPKQNGENSSKKNSKPIEVPDYLTKDEKDLKKRGELLERDELCLFLFRTQVMKKEFTSTDNDSTNLIFELKSSDPDSNGAVRVFGVHEFIFQQIDLFKMKSIFKVLSPFKLRDNFSETKKVPVYSFGDLTAESFFAYLTYLYTGSIEESCKRPIEEMIVCASKLKDKNFVEKFLIHGFQHVCSPNSKFSEEILAKWNLFELIEIIHKYRFSDSMYEEFIQNFVFKNTCINSADETKYFTIPQEKKNDFNSQYFICIQKFVSLFASTVEKNGSVYLKENYENIECIFDSIFFLIENEIGETEMANENSISKREKFKNDWIELIKKFPIHFIDQNHFMSLLRTVCLHQQINPIINKSDKWDLIDYFENQKQISELKEEEEEDVQHIETENSKPKKKRKFNTNEIRLKDTEKEDDEEEDDDYDYKSDFIDDSGLIQPPKKKIKSEKKKTTSELDDELDDLDEDYDGEFDEDDEDEDEIVEYDSDQNREIAKKNFFFQKKKKKSF